MERLLQAIKQKIKDHKQLIHIMTTSYYEIESMHGIMKISGYSIINLYECNYKQLNNYVYNCIDEFLKLESASY